MVRTSKKKVGQRFSASEREAFYAGLFKYHILGGFTYAQCAEKLQVDKSTIVFHCSKYTKNPNTGGFLRWLKERHPERFDRDYIVHRFIDRSEDRRQDARSVFAKEGVEVRDQARLIKEMREEDVAQLKLLQDIGVVEASQEAHVQAPVIFMWGAPTKGAVPKSKK